MRMGIEMMFDPTTYYHYVIYDFAQSFQEALVMSTDTFVVRIDYVPESIAVAYKIQVITYVQPALFRVSHRD